jgi:hypothetical protein
MGSRMAPETEKGIGISLRSLRLIVVEISAFSVFSMEASLSTLITSVAAPMASEMFCRVDTATEMVMPVCT